MTARCNRICFNAANRAATATFCAILGGGGGSLSASRAATRLAQQRNTAQLPRASSRSPRRFARHPARIVRALISAQFPRASSLQPISRNFRAHRRFGRFLQLPGAPFRAIPRASYPQSISRHPARIVPSVPSVACVPFSPCANCPDCAPMRFVINPSCT